MKRILIIVGLLVLVTTGIVGFITYRNHQFRLVSSEPIEKGSTVAPVIFTFNRNLDPKTLQAFEIQPYTAGRSQLKDNKFVFEPSDNYHLTQDYTAKLKSVTAADGSTLGEQVIQFKVEFIPLNELSEADRAAQMANTDPLEQQNPFLAKLPHETLEYKIDYELVSGGEGEAGIILVVELYAIINRPDQRAAYEAQLREYKQKALQWIQLQGIEPNKYPITFIPAV